MATVNELVTRFGFEIDDKALKELQEGIDAVKDGIIGLGAALVGEAVGLYEIVTHASEAGVQLKIMSQETGLAVQRLQELQFVAKLSEVSTEELNTSLAHMSRTLTEAKMGSQEARRHLRLYGISVEEIRSGTLTTDVVLKRMSATFAKMPNGPEKTGRAMQIFGRSGARMVAFLNNLSKDLDPVNQKLLEMSMVTEDQVEQAEKFHESLETLKTGITGVVRVIGFGLMPAATEVVEQMKKWLVENREIIKQNLTEFVLGMVSALKLTIKIVDALVKSLSGLAHGLGGVQIMTKLVLGGFALLSGASVLYGIGRVTQAVVALSESLAAVDLLAAAVPVAIGAAFIALLLIMEDIYSFFQGKDSFTGDLLKMIPQLGDAIKSILDPIFEPFVNIITMISDGLGSWKDILKELGILIVNALLTPFRLVGNTLGLITSGIAKLTGSTGVADFAKELYSAADDFKIKSAWSNPTGITPSSAVGSPANRGQQNSVHLEQEFNFPPGTDPATVGDKMTTAVSDGLDDGLRKASRATGSGGQY